MLIYFLDTFMKNPFISLLSTVNDIVYSDLGCATALGDNSVAICQSLHNKNSNSTLEDCQLCNRNGCNKYFYNNQTPWTANWNRADKSIPQNMLTTLLVFAMALLLAC